MDRRAEWLENGVESGGMRRKEKRENGMNIGALGVCKSAMDVDRRLKVLKERKIEREGEGTEGKVDKGTGGNNEWHEWKKNRGEQLTEKLYRG